MSVQEPTHCPHRRQILVVWVEFRGDHCESHKDSKVNSSDQSFYRRRLENGMHITTWAKKRCTKYAVCHKSNVVKPNDKPAYPQHTARNRLANPHHSHVTIVSRCAPKVSSIRSEPVDTGDCQLLRKDDVVCGEKQVCEYLQHTSLFMLHPKNHHQNRIVFLYLAVIESLPSETVWSGR